MNYILVLFSTATAVLFSAAMLNWTVDPAGLFQNTSFGKRYANDLLASEYGLVLPESFDEREFKAELAKHAFKYDCIVIGSSRVMQIGSARTHRAFPTCSAILNLGVSGAVIQDQLVLVWLSLSNGKPRTIILGVDPWTFAIGDDERWKIRYAEQYPIARREIGGESLAISTSLNRWSSLVSAQYTKRSVDHLLRGAAASPIAVAQKVDETVGGKFPITLPDGSLVYSAESIAKAKNDKIPVGGETYRTDGMTNDSRAIDIYRQMIIWIKEHDVRPILLMAPYHHNVWMLETSPNVKAMVPTETIVRRLGRELDVPVLGSFRPNIVGCLPDEFLDAMHPMARCIARFSSKGPL